MPRLVGYGFPNAPASAVIHSRTDLIIFGDPLWLISFFRFVFDAWDLIPCSIWLLWICMVHLAVPLCRWSWHPLPSVFTQRLCIHIHSIAFLACCSNLAEESFIQSASHARAMGNCSTCCIGRGKEVGMADDGRCVSFVVLKRVDNDLWQRSQIQAFLLSAASNDLSKMP